MRDATTTAVTGAAGYAPPVRPVLLAEALGRILAGQPLPEELRPAVTAVSRPASVREGIERMLVAHCPYPA